MRIHNTWEKIGNTHTLVVDSPYRKIEITGPRPYNVSLYFWNSLTKTYNLASSHNLSSSVSLQKAKEYGEKLLYPEPIDPHSSSYRDG